MKFGPIALAGALAAILTLPAAAQTTQMTPSKPTSTLNTPAPATPPRTTAATSTLVDINSASAADLDRLPGIGKARADAIIKNRPYAGNDDLLNRHIVPPNVYKDISDKIIAKRS